MHCHFRNDRVVQWCTQAGIHVTAYAPLSSPQTMQLEGMDNPNLLKVCYRLAAPVPWQLFAQATLSFAACDC